MQHKRESLDAAFFLLSIRPVNNPLVRNVHHFFPMQSIPFFGNPALRATPLPSRPAQRDALRPSTLTCTHIPFKPAHLQLPDCGGCTSPRLAAAAL